MPAKTEHRPYTADHERIKQTPKMKDHGLRHERDTAVCSRERIACGTDVLLLQSSVCFRWACVTKAGRPISRRNRPGFGVRKCARRGAGGRSRLWQRQHDVVSGFPQHEWRRLRGGPAFCRSAGRVPTQLKFAHPGSPARMQRKQPATPPSLGRPA